MIQQAKVKLTVSTNEQLLIVNRDSEVVKQLQVSEPETWRLLTLAFGSGPIYSSDVTEASRLKDESALALSGLTFDQIMQVENAAQPILNEYRAFTEKNDSLDSSQTALLTFSKIPSLPISEHHDATFVFKSPVIDERLQKAVHDIFELVRKILDARKKMKLALEQAKYPPQVLFPLDINSRGEENKPGVKVWLQKHILWPLRSWRFPRFDWSIVWIVGILIGLFGFIGYMGYLTGEFRQKLPANATGFQVVLPPGHSWKALGKSEWTSGRIAGEPYRIVINRLEPKEYDALNEIMARGGKEVTLPAGKALRSVVPRRGPLYLQTSELGIGFLINAGLGGWLITSFCLTEAEADALARSFVVDNTTR